MRLLAIDPGPTKSAYVVFDRDMYTVVHFGKENNLAVLAVVENCLFTTNILDPKPSELVIEQVDHYGMPVGADVFETVFWSGRFFQAWSFEETAYRLPRREVKKHLCSSPRATDATIRQAVIDRFGGNERAIGAKKCQSCKGKGWRGRNRELCIYCTYGWSIPPGPLHRISADVWQALALALTFCETRVEDDDGKLVKAPPAPVRL